MTRAAPTLPIGLRLGSPLLAAGEAAGTALSGRIEAELSELLDDLGVPARPRLTLERSDDESPRLLGLVVRGRRCRFATTMIADAISYVDGTPKVPTNAEEMLDRMRGEDSDWVVELLATVCRAAVSAAPEMALDPGLGSAARAMVSLGLSIAGRTAKADCDPLERLIAEGAAGRIDVEIDPDYLRTISLIDGAGDLFPAARDGLCAELGLPLAPFHFRPNPSMRRNTFAFRFNAVRGLPRVGLTPGTLLVSETVGGLAPHDIEAEPTLDPAIRLPRAIVADKHGESLRGIGLTTWNPLEYLVYCLSSELPVRAHVLMTREVSTSMARELARRLPVVGAAAEARADELAPLLRELLVDQVPIRNLPRIVELMLRYETIGSGARRLDRVGFVRAGLGDLITSRAAGGAGTLGVTVLDPRLEDALTRPDEDDPWSEEVVAAVRTMLVALAADTRIPAIVTRDDLRARLRALLRHEFPELAVLAYAEVPPDRDVQVVARISSAPPRL